MSRLAWNLFLVADATVLVLYTIGYAARYVHPRYLWWGELVAVGLPYLGVTVCGLAAVWALRRRWGGLLVHLLFVGLVVGRHVPMERLLHLATEGENDLTMMTFNAPGWRYPDTDFKESILLQLALAYQPEVVALQEAYTFARGEEREPRPVAYIDALADSLGYTPIWPVGVEGVNNLHPVFTWLPVLEQSQVPLAPRPDAEEVKTRSFTRTVLQWKGRPFVLYNLYLQSFGAEKPWHEERSRLGEWAFWAGYAHQYREAILDRVNEVEQVRRHMAAEELPVVVAGDFNSTPHNWTYYHLSKGRQDAFQTAGRGWGATFHERLPFVRIDFFLVDPAFEIVNARPLLESTFSDHRPLVTRLRWRDE